MNWFFHDCLLDSMPKVTVIAELLPHIRKVQLNGVQKVPRGASGSESPQQVHSQRVVGVVKAKNGCVSKVRLAGCQL
jgi:hypothetical protein